MRRQQNFTAFQQFSTKEVEINELIIETDRQVYTEKYIVLTKDFYLKM